MERNDQRVLIYSGEPETIDLIVDLCDSSNEPTGRISVAQNESQLEDLFEHHQFMLAFVVMSGWDAERILDRIAFQLSPKPTIAVVESQESSLLLQAMRNGADSVFTLPELRHDTGPLVYCLDRQIKRAEEINRVHQLRDSLSKSLEELKADHTAARQVQERLLPPTYREVDGLRCSYRLKPSMLLSGDFVDLIRFKENKVLFYLADVSGHGASSALVTVLLKNTTNRIMKSYRLGENKLIEDPQAILHQVNNELIEASLGKHLTMFIGIIDCATSELTYAVGGHHPMPILASGDEVRFLEGRGMPLGLFEEAQFDQCTLSLPEQFNIFLFSDGILELLDNDSLLEKEQNLLELCRGLDASPETILDAVVERTEINNPDDVAVMMVSR